MIIRLDKYLTEMGYGSRSDIKDMIKRKRVAVDGTAAKSPDLKIDTDKNHVMLDGEEAVYEEFQYFMLNKPQNIVTATQDRKSRTVLDLIDTRKRYDLFPVGRLDKDTEGLLLITNDGDLAHRLLSPKKHVDKVYYAEIDGIVTKEHAELFKDGMTISGDEECMPAILRIISTDEAHGISRVEITIREGKYHQVKRMFEAISCQVTFLKRLSMGPLCLDENLCAGAYRRLTLDEILQLKGE